MSLTRHAIESAPACDASELITLDYDIKRFKHYGQEVKQVLGINYAMPLRLDASFSHDFFWYMGRPVCQRQNVHPGH